MEGMAFQEPPHGKICALYHTVSGYGDIRILGAGRRKPAAGSEMGRDRCLIKPDQQQETFFNHSVVPLLFFFPLLIPPDGPFFQTRSAEAVVF